MKPDYDVLIIGSGFGGSVTALRLTEKGYRVGVLEAGRRFSDEDFAKTSWNLRKFLWAPKLGMYGIQRIHLLRNVMILAGAGVGGGSLNYANTLYVPPEPFFADKQWAHITDWRAELTPHYQQAQRMLGVVTNPTFTDADRIVKEVADDMGCGDTFVPTPVGVFFGPDGTKKPGETVPDPFFGGAGPARTGCLECGCCMTGCRYGAKNTLLKNYLGLAESAGAEVIPMTTVTGFEQRSDGIWEVRTARTGRWLRRKKRTFTATHLVLAAGTWGTQHLLFKMRDKGKLPALSDRLGVLTRTNSESIVGAATLKVSPDLDLTHGVAITSSIHPTSDTHIEPVRYGKGSNAMGLLQTLMTDGSGPDGTDVPRWRQLLHQADEDPRGILRMLNPRQWSERTVIALVMQHLDNSITTFTKRGKLGRRRYVSKQGHGEPNPTLDPGRQRGHPPHRRQDRRRRRRNLGRAVQHPADRALPRRRGDRRQPRTRRHRPVSPGVRLPDAVGGGRCRDLGESRRQPVTVDHRAGRAGRVAVAEQGGKRLRPRPGRAVPSAGPDRAAASGGAGRRARRAALAADRADQLGWLTDR